MREARVRVKTTGQRRAWNQLPKHSAYSQDPAFDRPQHRACHCLTRNFCGLGECRARNARAHGELQRMSAHYRSNYPSSFLFACRQRRGTLSSARSKAPESWRSPRRFANWKADPNRRKLLECGPAIAGTLWELTFKWWIVVGRVAPENSP